MPRAVLSGPVVTSRMLEHIGRVLGDRYRIVAPIGAGASALVFLADDVVLKRQVAVKLLHEGLTGDQRFLERFRSEAQTTASLNHQHLVAVYDWGYDDVPYLVTEYLAGGSLQTLLDSGHQLTPSQALLVGLEASRALEYAHRRGLIHRDIKPSNLLFGEDGRLRIADFGLARALAEASITEPVGAVLGSARYASPEQARGEQVDEKSDVYSLALLMVEAVTGDVPFAADTMLATLMARVDAELPVPDDLGPLQEPLQRAGHPDPSDRPDASAFAASLLEKAESLPRPELLPLAGALNTPLGAELSPTDMGERPDGPTDEASDAISELGSAEDWAEPSTVADGAADEFEEDPVNDLPSVVAAAGAASPALGALARNDAVETSDSLFPESGLFFDPGDPTTAVGVAETDAAPTTVIPTTGLDDPAVSRFDETPAALLSPRQERRAAREQRRKEAAMAAAAGSEDERDDHASLLSILAGFLILIVLGAGLWFLYQSTDTEDVAVPNLVGRTVDELNPLIGANGWEVVQLQGRQSGSDVGEIIAQSPAEGTIWPAEEQVRVTVSIGNEMVPIPTELLGVGVEEARLRLNAIGLEVGDTTEVPDETVPLGGIVRVNEAAFELPEGDTVDLVLSLGPVPRSIPDDLVGIPVADAEQRLIDLRLEPLVQTAFSYEFPLDAVMQIAPDPGTEVEVGTTVGLFVSLGPEPIEVPDVIGMTLGDARTALEDILLCVDRVDGRTTDDAEVIFTEPEIGEFVTDPEDCVRIVTSTAEPDEDDG